VPLKFHALIQYHLYALVTKSLHNPAHTFHRFPYPDKDPKAHAALLDSLYTLTSDDGTPIGYILESVFNALVKVPIKIKGELEVSRAKRTICAFNPPPTNVPAWTPPTTTPTPPAEPSPPSVTEAQRSALVAATTAYWKEKKTFAVLDGWRDELYPVYGPGNELLFSVERSASTLLGVVTYGVHMTAFVRDEGSSYGIKIWVPRRAKNKQTYGGMLDNTVAGGSKYCSLMAKEDLRHMILMPVFSGYRRRTF
jgi:hypothetical protein